MKLLAVDGLAYEGQPADQGRSSAPAKTNTPIRADSCRRARCSRPRASITTAACATRTWSATGSKPALLDDILAPRSALVIAYFGARWKRRRIPRGPTRLPEERRPSDTPTDSIFMLTAMPILDHERHVGSWAAGPHREPHRPALLHQPLPAPRPSAWIMSRPFSSNTR